MRNRAPEVIREATVVREGEPYRLTVLAPEYRDSITRQRIRPSNGQSKSRRATTRVDGLPKKLPRPIRTHTHR